MLSQLKPLRLQKGMTQTEIAVSVGVSLTTYQLWERQVSTPSKQNMEKLKKVLNIND